MSDAERRRRNVILAHAKVQGELLVLMMAVSGGYEEEHPRDERRIRDRLVYDTQSVVDAAVELRRVVLSGGDVRPTGGDEE